MRHIILDTETTGLRADEGDRIVEIGCLEVVHYQPSGKTFQSYLDPERPVSAKTTEITGITDETVRGQPKFADIVEDFLAFIGDAKLVMHNADFDVSFLNAELKRAGYPEIDRGRVIDTLAIARKKFPGSPASLDALCRRFGVDNSARDKHGALLDSELLAEVYLELMGGRQPGLIFQSGHPQEQETQNGQRRPQSRRATALPSRIRPEEVQAHDAFLEQLPVSAMWRH